jgi:hypothetical protein
LVILLFLCSEVVALILTFVPARWASMAARGIVLIVSVGGTVLILFFAFVLAHFGTSFGGQFGSGDLLFVACLAAGAIYLLGCGAALWLPYSARARRFVILAHVCLMPLITIVSGILIPSPRPAIQALIYLFVGSCYALIWIRTYDTRTGHNRA